jgi:hypothetical protein
MEITCNEFTKRSTRFEAARDNALILKDKSKMNAFEKNFQKNFIAHLPRASILDDGAFNPKGGVADFLLNDKRIVAELKCIDANMLQKVQEFATSIIEGRNLNFYGSVPFDRIIKDQQDRLELNREAIFKVCKPLEKDFKKANSQIRNIKNKLQLKDSHGLLILVNTQNSPLEPKLALWFLSLLFNRRKQNGQPICSSIDCILYLTQLHTLGELDGVHLQPALKLMRDGRSDYQPLETYLNEFLEEWAAFNHIPLFMAEESYEQIKDFSMTPMRRRVLPKSLREQPTPPYIAAKFPFPALCRECGDRFAHPAGNGSSMDVHEPQKDCFVVGFVCPRCDQIAETRVADLAVDREGDVIRVYPWTGTLDDFLRVEWRTFIDRNDPPSIEWQ